MEEIEEQEEEHRPAEVEEITGRESALPGDSHLNEGDDEAGEPPSQNPLQTDFPIAFFAEGDQEHQNQNRETDVQADRRGSLEKIIMIPDMAVDPFDEEGGLAEPERPEHEVDDRGEEVVEIKRHVLEVGDREGILDPKIEERAKPQIVIDALDRPEYGIRNQTG